MAAPVKEPTTVRGREAVDDGKQVAGRRLGGVDFQPSRREGSR